MDIVLTWLGVYVIVLTAGVGVLYYTLATRVPRLSRNFYTYLLSLGRRPLREHDVQRLACLLARCLDLREEDVVKLLLAKADEYGDLIGQLADLKAKYLALQQRVVRMTSVLKARQKDNFSAN